MQTSKKLPIGIDNFPELIEEGYHYVDKTQLIHQLCTVGKNYFLSRPRRFGKSLLLSTIEALYQGRKELFKGLWIEDQWDWDQRNPVVRISMNQPDYKAHTLFNALNRRMDLIAESLGLTLRADTPKEKFEELLNSLSGEGKVVVLIDEYDAPIIDFLTVDDRRAKENRALLHDFYLTLKTSGEAIQFAMLTGVGRFSRAGVFSGLNNLNDISIKKDYATLLGYTQEELEADFSVELQAAADEMNMPLPELLSTAKDTYNGYKFHIKAASVYNPFSVLKFLDDREFRHYWFVTGTPTFLVNLLREKGVYQLQDIRVTESAFDNSEIERLEYIPLLLQTGYLTIKDYDTRTRRYTLGFPNREVEQAFVENLLAIYTQQPMQQVDDTSFDLLEAFQVNNLQRVREVLHTLFAGIPYDLSRKDWEGFYHGALHLLFSYMGMLVQSEVHVSGGRLDTVIETQTHIYILEYKLDDSASTALAQIRQRGYADRFRNSGKALLGIGIGFSSQSRNVSDFAWEEL